MGHACEAHGCLSERAKARNMPPTGSLKLAIEMYLEKMPPTTNPALITEVYVHHILEWTPPLQAPFPLVSFADCA